MILNFDPEEKYILEDERVLLRPLQDDDIQFLLPFAINERETWVYSQIDAAGEPGMSSYIHNAVIARTTGKEYPFIVYDKENKAYAGCTRFYDIQPNNQTLQLGYTWYGEKFRGTGLNKHCKFLLLQFAFEALNMERVEFRADLRNERSIAAMKSIGCRQEGIIRSHLLLKDGSRRNSVILSILKNEWENGVQEQLKNKL